MQFTKSHLVYIFSIAFIALIFLSSSIIGFSASNRGNITSNIEDGYAPGDEIRGWINISLADEPFNSQITAFSNNITVIDFLIKNKLIPRTHYNCSTYQCGITYDTVDNGSSSKSLTLNSGQTRLLGIKIDDAYFQDVSSFKLNLSSSASADCNGQLKIDIGNDGIWDWAPTRASGEACSTKNYGCYATSATQADFAVGTYANAYCENIEIGPAPGIVAGADVTGTGNANFTLYIDTSSCSQTISASGIVSCTINMSLREKDNVTLCIRQNSGSAYKINYDRTAPVCGDSVNDYSIFAQQLKYDSVGNVMINVSLDSVQLGSLMDQYIDEKYHRDCSRGCSVPIKIYSGQDNNVISITQVETTYNAGAKISLDKIYELSQSPSKITMPFTRLNFTGSGLKVPTRAGSYNLSLKIGGYEIVNKKIDIKSMPVIKEVYPLDVPAGANVYFTVIAEDTNITGYRWDFGDNTSIASVSSNHLSHRYNEVRKYNLVVYARNVFGETNKTFSINVISPKEYLPIAFADYKKRIADIRAQVAVSPSLISSYIERRLNLSSSEMTVASLEARSKIGNLSTSEYINIANALLAIELPNAVIMAERAYGRFIVDPSKMDLASLQGITSESISGDETVIKNSLMDWNVRNLAIDVDYRAFVAMYENASVPLASYFNVQVNPRSSLSSAYAIISRPRSSLELGSSIGNVQSSGNSVGFALDLSSPKSFEFAVINERPGMLDTPLYFSPPLAELSTGFNISACNFNDICEKDLGEDADNCRADCTPWGRTFFWLIFVLILFLAAYIAAQEWYKRKYESYLFKDKNDLFNLIHFISNAEKQGLKREEIFQKLREKNWDNEQINYAYNKFKGQRTGMWEIPIFKFWENKQVKKEVDLRNKVGINQKITPKPINPFVKQPMFLGKKPIMAQNQKTLPMQNQAIQQKPLIPGQQNAMKPAQQPIQPQQKPAQSNQPQPQQKPSTEQKK
jgi:hypothetical protein